VAVAGFSGVIVALESRGVKAWTPARRRDLRVLLQLSGLALAFSLIPLFAYPQFETASFWNWALGVYGLAHLADVSSFLFRQPAGVRRGPVFAGLVVALLQLSVAFVGRGSVPEVAYLASVLWHLGGAGMGFVFLIWGDRSGGASED
jgi:hypothetical protein